MPELAAIVFTDIVGYSAKLQQDPQAARRLLDRQRQVIRRLLCVFGGREVETAGDAFLLEFAGCTAALECVAQVQRALAGDAPGERVHLRASIHLGEISRHGEDVGGEGVSVAARLLPHSPVAGVAFSRAVQRQLVEGFEVAPLALGTRALRNIPLPVEVFTLEACTLFALGASRRRSVSAAPATAAAQPSTDGGTTRPRIDVNLHPSERLGARPQWQLVRRMGCAGATETWLAEHASSRELRLFRLCSEAHALAGLRREVALHQELRAALGERPDTARILDWNFDEAPYFVQLEYAAGGDLPSWAARHGGLAAIALHRRVSLAARVAETLAAAHAAGVVHGNLTPAQLLVTHEAPQRTAIARPGALAPAAAAADAIDVRVAGFGSEPATATAAPGTAPKSRHASWLAPELLAGEQATRQSDIYALGVLLFQLVVGDLERPLAPGWEEDIADEVLREDIACAVHVNPRRRLNDAGALARRLRSLDTRRAARQNEETIAELRRRGAQRRAAVRRSGRHAAALAGLCVLSLLALAWQHDVARAARLDDAEARAFVTSLLTPTAGRDVTPETQSAVLLRARAMLREGGLAHDPQWRDSLARDIDARLETLHEAPPEAMDVRQSRGSVAGGRAVRVALPAT